MILGILLGIVIGLAAAATVLAVAYVRGRLHWLAVSEYLPRLTSMSERLEASAQHTVDSLERLNKSAGELAAVLKDVRVLAGSTEQLVEIAKKVDASCQGVISANELLRKSHEECVAQYRASLETAAATISAFGVRETETGDRAREVLKRPPPGIHVTSAEDNQGTASGSAFTRQEE